MRILLIIFSILFFATSLSAQERSYVRKGNELYNQKKYKEASAAYVEALKKQPTYTPGAFNLGNALIQQKLYDAARKVMDNTSKTSKDPAVQSGAKYNTGNTYMDEQKWQEAVNAYKQALRKNPSDGEAKYNLSYALSKMKQQQQQGGGKDDKKKEDQKQDKNKPDSKKDDKENGKDQNAPKEGDDKKPQEQGKPQPSKLSEQQAENLLNALQQDERKTQDKMQQAKGMPVKLEKDW